MYLHEEGMDDYDSDDEVWIDRDGNAFNLFANDEQKNATN